jgi:hypothetical protein
VTISIISQLTVMASASPRSGTSLSENSQKAEAITPALERRAVE